MSPLSLDWMFGRMSRGCNFIILATLLVRKHGVYSLVYATDKSPFLARLEEIKWHIKGNILPITISNYGPLALLENLWQQRMDRDQLLPV
jgi:hypothetical protein